MSDARRKIVLLGILGVVGAGVAADKAFTRFVRRPQEAEQRRFADLDDKATKVELATARASKKLARRSLYQERSLPSNLEFAVSAYSDWLLELVQESGLKRANLSASQPTAVKRLYRKIQFNLRGTGDLSQITQFLYDFYQSGHLHKIRSLSLNPLASGRVDMTLTIEALSVLSGGPAEQLSNAKANRLAGDSLDFYRLISKRDLFQSVGNTWAQTTKLAAVTTNAIGQQEAWFAAADGRTVVAPVEKTVDVGGRDILVSELGSGFAKIVVDGDEFRIALGETLADCFHRR